MGHIRLHVLLYDMWRGVSQGLREADSDSICSLKTNLRLYTVTPLEEALDVLFDS